MASRLTCRLSRWTQYVARRQLVGASHRLASSGPFFGLSEEQAALKETARRFARAEILPLAAEYDRSMEYPWEVLKKAHALGLLNGNLPASCGGLGLGLVEDYLFIEECAYACTGMTQALSVTKVAQTPLVLFGTPDQQKRFLGRMVDDCLVASYAVTEPSTGSDVASLRTRARRVGDDWVINGEKMYITNAGHADWLFILARSDDDPKCSTGSAFTGFIVEKDTPGLTVGKKEIMMGQRCGDTRSVFLEDVKVPKENVVSEVGAGFKVAMRTFDYTRLFVAGLATGLIQRALEESTKYAVERKTFGVPIAQHQAVSNMIADMAMGVELTRQMSLLSSWLFDHGRRNTYYASVSKLFGADSCMKAALDCVQIFGGNGFNTEYPAEKLMRDAKIISIYEGSTQIQRQIIHRELSGKLQRRGVL